MVVIDRKKLEDLQLTQTKMIVHFYSTASSNSAAAQSILEGLELQYPKIKFYKFNVEKDKNYTEELGITTMPTLILYKGKEIYEIIFGVTSLDYYKRKLNELSDE
jgi:thioredoxin-like negative regulator of GroEL